MNNRAEPPSRITAVVHNTVDFWVKFKGFILKVPLLHVFHMSLLHTQLSSIKTRTTPILTITKSRVLETGVGVIIGRAFQDMIRSFVNDILVPPLALIFGDRIVNLMFVLRRGRSGHRPQSVEEAYAMGAITINYGRFIHQIMNFFTVGAAVYYFLKGISCY